MIGVVSAKGSTTEIGKLVEAANGRVGAGAQGVLLDKQGLVVANTVDPSWTLRPVMPLAANVLESMNSDRRWGTSPALQPLNDARYHAGRHVERHVGVMWTSQIRGPGSLTTRGVT